MIENINCLMIGWGPHATRTYSNFFKKYQFEPRVVVDLESQRERVQTELKIFGFNTAVETIPDKEKDFNVLSLETKKKFEDICSKYEITHVIIAPEPKAHYAYMDYFVEKKVHMLVEKPIVAPPNFYTIEDAQKAKDQFYDILSRQKPNTQCKVMCQRKMNRGYRTVLSLARDIVGKYNVPVTKIYVNHCDGNWIMPHDLFYENHPYKYGYGKLFHSGYHFIDLFADIVKVNQMLSSDKKLERATIFSSFQMTSDEYNIFRPDEIVTLFENLGQQIPSFYDGDVYKTNYDLFGEKAITSQICFTNGDGKCMTLGNLSISQIGFSRRAWINAHEDHYKNNGRVRHETVEIEIGPLMCIQVHSYQSKEIKDRSLYESEIGGLDHFDICIYRNSELIGGKPFEKITSEMLMKNQADIGIKGLNEDSREDFIYNFFSNAPTSKGELIDHRLAIEILYYICKQEIDYRNGVMVSDTFDISKLA